MTLLCLCSLTETGGSYKVFLIRSTLRHWVPLFSYGFCEELLFYLVWCYCLVWRFMYLELGKTENMNFLLTFSMSLLILWLILILLVFPFSRCCSNSFLYGYPPVSASCILLSVHVYFVVRNQSYACYSRHVCLMDSTFSLQCFCLILSFFLNLRT